MASLKFTGIIPFVISFLLYILLVPVLLFFCFLNELSRSVVSIYLLLKYKGQLKLVSDGCDGIWAWKRPGKNRMSLVAVKVEDKLDAEALLNLIDKVRWHRNSRGERLYEKFDHILTKRCGYACWKRDDLYRPSNHLRVLTKNIVHTEEDVKDLFKSLTEDMDESRGQWEYIIIPRYKGDKDQVESSMLCIRFHHAYADGVSVAMLVKNILTSNYTDYLDALEFKIPFFKKLLYYTNAFIFAPFTSICLARRNSEFHWPVLQLLPEEKIERNYTWSNELNMDVIKRIKTAMNGKISVSTIVQNAFISAAVDTLPRKRIPKKWSIGEAVALLPYPNKFPQNRVSGFIHYVATQDEEDFTRLEKSQANVARGFLGPCIPVIYWIFKLLGRFPLPIIGCFQPGGLTSMIYSNVPSSRTEMRLKVNNGRFLELFAYPPHYSGTGITLLGVGYQNSLKLCAEAASNCLRKEELETIVAKVPEVLQNWSTKCQMMEHQGGIITLKGGTVDLIQQIP